MKEILEALLNGKVLKVNERVELENRLIQVVIEMIIGRIFMKIW